MIFKEILMTIVLSNLNSYIYMNKFRDVKLQLFRATTETIVLMGSSAWTLTKAEEKVHDGTYTQILRLVSFWSARRHGCINQKIC